MFMLAENDTVWTGLSGVILGILIGLFLLVSIITMLAGRNK